VSLHRRTDRCRVDAPGAPVAAYSFNEGSGTTTADATGNNHPGTLINGPTWATGHTGSAVKYDGVNYYVSAGNITALNGLTAVTVSAGLRDRWALPRRTASEILADMSTPVVP
jgi:hypothetical protein